MKLKPIPQRKLISLLGLLGYFPVRQKGSHLIFQDKAGKLIVVPMHSKDIGVGLLREIIKELGLTRDEFVEKLG